MNWGWYGLCGILFAVGVFFDVVNIGTLVANKKGGHVSGVPFLGALFFAASLLVLPVTRPFFMFGILLDVTVYSLPGTIAFHVKANKYRNHFKIVVLAEDSTDEGTYTDRSESGLIGNDAEGSEYGRDGTENSNKLCAEHGLSLYIEYGADKLLLDAGQSGLFAENAKKLGVDLSKVDDAILSHAHYDHADGFETFLEINKKAKLYVRKEAKENCYSEHADGLKYIGPKKGMFEKYAKRIKRVEGDFCPVRSWGTILIPHNTKGLEEIGKRAKLFKETDGKMVPDDFDHEQTLILYSPKGIVVCNSCSHAGPINILREVREYLDDENREIYAYIGGFHLSKASDEEVYELAESLKNANVKHIITGHCTGERAFEILREELGESIIKMHTGMVIDFGDLAELMKNS